MEIEYAICRVPVSPMRTEPSDKAEISTQLLFGEHIEVIEKNDRWWYVRNAYDNYEGWVDFRQYAPLSLEAYVENHNCRFIVPAQVSSLVEDHAGSTYFLSPSSNLPLYQDNHCYLGSEKYRVLFNPLDTRDGLELRLIETAMFFRNVPYLWGGRNLFGMDCSGFVQTVFKLNGMRVNRDAYQQAEEGRVVDFLSEVVPGDVAFFDNAEGRITHVGLMISPSQIIHASAKVRIDQIDNEGIYNQELGRYTHKLRIIKRFV